MNEADIRFLKAVYFEYYSKNSNLVEVPPPVNKREIGFVISTDKTMRRHLSFQSNEAIRKYIIENLPWDAFHSCSVYEFPENPIDSKNVMWNELSFDIDVKDLNCNEYSYKYCEECNEIYTNEEKCKKCGKPTKSLQFISSRCISKAYEKTKELVSTLMEDFGVEEKYIKVFYSGHLGFHVYLDAPLFREISQDERRELIDFLLLNEFQPNLFVSFSLLKIKNIGVGRRLINNIIQIIKSPEDYISIEKEIIEKIKGREERITNELKNGSLKLLVATVGKKHAESLLKKAIEISKIPIDPSVTLDEHRIIRMPGTLNSKSSLPKFKVDLWEKEDPLKNLPMYGEGTVKVRVKFSPSIRIRGENFRSLKDEVEELPRFYAAYLISKGVASIV